MSGILELAVGLSLIVVGLLLTIISLTSLRGRVAAGGVILIGPLPIVLGGGARAALAALILSAFLLTFAILLLYLGGAP